MPFGVFEYDGKVQLGIAIGAEIVDLNVCHKIGLFEHLDIPNVFLNDCLNDFIGLGKQTTNKVRMIIQKELCDQNGLLRQNSQDVLVNQGVVKLKLPIKIGNYTDFYSSKFHAENIGKLFRDPNNPLLPNWTKIPIAYHGRASSIVVSGTEVKRPKGQLIEGGELVYKSTGKLDYELEFAAVIGKENQLGEPVDINNAEEYIFGFCLFNDWSARDIQSWEYKPLGPFTGKNFASTISPWVVTIEALDDCKVPFHRQNDVLGYLKKDNDFSFDITLEVYLNETLVVKNNFKTLYWSVSQQIAHHTVSGCNLKIGDLLASGTISGKDELEKGCLMEKTYGGTRSFKLLNGDERIYLEDNDVVCLKAFAEVNGYKIGFGKAEGKIIANND